MAFYGNLTGRLLWTINKMKTEQKVDSLRYVTQTGFRCQLNLSGCTMPYNYASDRQQEIDMIDLITSYLAVRWLYKGIIRSKIHTRMGLIKAIKLMTTTNRITSLWVSGRIEVEGNVGAVELAFC